MRRGNVKIVVLAAALAMLSLPAARGESPADMQALMAKAKLVQEIDCSKPNKDLIFLEYPAKSSKVEFLLGTACRVLPNKEGEAKYFAYRIGEDKNLKPGGCYILTVEYPEDASRAMYICNWGCETAMGLATGQAIGDVLKGKYVPNNPESLKYPLSGKMQTWTQLFFLHDRTPEIKRPRGRAPRPLTSEQGFWVIIAQPAAVLDPLSSGAAVSKIRLYEVPDADALAVQLPVLPKGLPRRHIFSREEMADSAITLGHKEEEKDPKLRGVKDIVDWHEYKMRTMKFLGIDTFSKDLLEFGHNQGWDSSGGGGNDWVFQSSSPWLWEKVLDRAAKHKLNVLPMYEYRGSVGGSPKALGSQHRCRRLDGGETYSNITWCEGNNADVVDPDTAEDAKKILDETIVKYKDKVSFIGAWFRQRPTGMPMSFNDKDLKLFSQEANGGNRITRSHLQTNKELLEKYYAWWFGKRRQFFEVQRDHLRKQVGPETFILYTNDCSEPGRSLPRSITGEGRPNGWEWMQVVVNDDMDTWTKILTGEKFYGYTKPYRFAEVVDKNMHLRGLQTYGEDWGKYDNKHAAPPDDPKTYQDADGVMLSYTYNRLYTVGSAAPFDAYRTKSGLAMMRHYSLNENEMSVGNDELLGYFSVDVERAGPYCMLAEARAMAYGNPYYLGSLTGCTCNRGFPQYVRNFHANFLALPALPSTVVENAASDKDVIVRQIKTDKNGSYFAVVNTAFDGKKGVTVTLPAGNVVDAVSGKPVVVADGKITMDLYPGQLRSLRIS